MVFKLVENKAYTSKARNTTMLYYTVNVKYNNFEYSHTCRSTATIVKLCYLRKKNTFFHNARADT